MDDDSVRGPRVRVRRVSAAEAPALLAAVGELAVRSKASWGYGAHFMSRFAATMVPEHLASASRVTLIVEDEGQLVGVAVLDDGSSHAWLEDLWVDPAHFGRGIGRALFREACHAASRWGRSAIELESDPNAEGFYLAQGARRVDVRPSSLEPGRWMPVMRYDLA